MNSTVNHPGWYASGRIEVIEAIEDWKLDFALANTVKYVARAGKKDPSREIEDLEKAAWYLARKIERLKAEKEGRQVVRPNDMHPRSELSEKSYALSVPDVFVEFDVVISKQPGTVKIGTIDHTKLAELVGRRVHVVVTA